MVLMAKNKFKKNGMDIFLAAKNELWGCNDPLKFQGI